MIDIIDIILQGDIDIATDYYDINNQSLPYMVFFNLLIIAPNYDKSGHDGSPRSYWDNGTFYSNTNLCKEMYSRSGYFGRPRSLTCLIY